MADVKFSEIQEQFQMQYANLNEENESLKKCLQLLKQHSSLETANFISAIAAFYDEQFRKKFVETFERTPILANSSPEKYTTKAQNKSKVTSPETILERLTIETKHENVFTSCKLSSPPSKDPHRRHTVSSYLPRSDIRPHSPPQKGPSSFQKYNCNDKKQISPEDTGNKVKSSTTYVSKSSCSPKRDKSNYTSSLHVDSMHYKSHVSTATPVVSHLECDPLYIRSKVIAETYRMLAKKLKPNHAVVRSLTTHRPIKVNNLDRLCREVASIPPDIMFRKPGAHRNGTRVVYAVDRRNSKSPLAHSYTVRRPKGIRPKSSCPRRKSKVGFHKTRTTPSLCISCQCGRDPEILDSASDSKTEDAATATAFCSICGKSTEYNFKAAVPPIMEKVMFELTRAVDSGERGNNGSSRDPDAFKLTHTHRHYSYDGDGRAVLEQDVHEKSYHWSSSETDTYSEDETKKSNPPSDDWVQEVIHNSSTRLNEECVIRNNDDEEIYSLPENHGEKLNKLEQDSTLVTSEAEDETESAINTNDEENDESLSEEHRTPVQPYRTQHQMEDPNGPMEVSENCHRNMECNELHHEEEWQDENTLEDDNQTHSLDSLHSSEQSDCLKISERHGNTVYETKHQEFDNSRDDELVVVSQSKVIGQASDVPENKTNNYIHDRFSKSSFDSSLENSLEKSVHKKLSNDRQKNVSRDFNRLISQTQLSACNVVKYLPLKTTTYPLQPTSSSPLTKFTVLPRRFSSPYISNLNDDYPKRLKEEEYDSPMIYESGSIPGALASHIATNAYNISFSSFTKHTGSELDSSCVLSTPIMQSTPCDSRNISPNQELGQVAHPTFTDWVFSNRTKQDENDFYNGNNLYQTMLPGYIPSTTDELHPTHDRPITRQLTMDRVNNNHKTSSVAISGSSLAQYKIYGQSVDRNVFGEIAFQLERRIMDYVFAKCLPDDTVLRSDLGKSRRVYGYTVSRIGELISEEALSGDHYSKGTELMLRERLGTVLDLLTPLGYDLLEHGDISQKMISKYGLMLRLPSKVTEHRDGTENDMLGVVDVADLQAFIFNNADEEDKDDVLLLLDSLRMFAIEDGRPLFLWRTSVA